MLAISLTIASVDGSCASSRAEPRAAWVKVRSARASVVRKADAWVFAFIARVSWGSRRSPLSRSTPRPEPRMSLMSAPEPGPYRAILRTQEDPVAQLTERSRLHAPASSVPAGAQSTR